MLIPGLLFSLVVPMLAGVPWIIFVQQGRSAGSWPLAIAYGYVLGLLVTIAGICGMRWMSYSVWKSAWSSGTSTIG